MVGRVATAIWCVPNFPARVILLLPPHDVFQAKFLLVVEDVVTNFIAQRLALTGHGVVAGDCGVRVCRVDHDVDGGSTRVVGVRVEPPPADYLDLWIALRHSATNAHCVTVQIRLVKDVRHRRQLVRIHPSRRRGRRSCRRR